MDKKGLFVELFDLDLLNEIKSQPKLKKYIQDIESVRQSYINKEIPEIPFHLFKLYYTNGNRKYYELAYFERRRRLMTFGLSLWLNETEENLVYLEDIMWAICNEYSWVLPAHTEIDNPISIDLFASETAFALAEIIHLHGDKLSQVVKERCIKEIRRRVIYTYLNADQKYNWEKEKNNWCAVCAGSIGMATLYLESDEIIEKILLKIQPRLADFVGSFEEDGACLEGISYWTYGLSFYVAFADLLKQSKFSKVDLLDEEKFKKIALFQQKCHLKGNQTISFSDGYQFDDYRLGLTTYLSHFVEGVRLPYSDHVAGYQSDACYRWCHGIRDLIWTTKYQEKPDISQGKDKGNLINKEELEDHSAGISKKVLEDHSDLIYKKENSDSPTTYVLPHAQWLICDGNKGFAIKGGHNFEPHNHNDIGHFVYYKNGRNILADLGAGEYVKDYFNEKRYTIFCNRSISHSVPIINGHEQVEGLDRCAKLNELNETSIDMDIESSYDLAYLKKLNRRAVFDYERGIQLIDTYVVDSDHTAITERFISYYKPVIQDGHVVLGEKDSVSQIKVLNKDLDISLEIKAFDHMDHGGNKVTIYAADFNFILNSGSSKIEFNIE